jgi:hypothetical protein
MNDTIPKYHFPRSASGRFVLRINPGLHAALRNSARAAGLSLNEFCARKLAFPGAMLSGPALDAVARATQVVGDALLAVVAFGSWARREMSESSDVDLLVVLEREWKIDRSLYRSWDESPLLWNGHPVEPHFVYLPEPGQRLSGLWAEVAVEGLVLFDRDLVVSRRLADFRGEIAAGRVRRGHAHGQSYWVEVAEDA